MSGTKVWHALDVVCEATAAEAVEYGLMEAGADGVEEQLPATGRSGDSSALVAYFGSPPDEERVRAAITEALRVYSLPAFGTSVREMRAREVAARDWLSEWKAGWRPVEVGARFLIAPPWSEEDAARRAEAANRVAVLIEPGMAFGTGTHETTRLCLGMIERHFDGDSFLDVGTGTGILAIAAAKLRPAARVEACDTDADAVDIARVNAALNGVAARIAFRVGSVGAATTSASCVCANLTTDVIVPLLPDLLGATCERLILSGILAAQATAVTDELRRLGVADYSLASDGEWVAVVV